MNDYYVYEWYKTDTNEIFYVVKGRGSRYLQTRNRNKNFLDIYNSTACRSRIIYSSLEEEDAYRLERETIEAYKSKGIVLANIAQGGGGSRGTKLTPECKELHRKNSKERWKNPEFRQRQLKLRNDPDGPYKNESFRKKISTLVQGTKNPNYQHYWSDEQKEHLRNIQKVNSLYYGDTNPNAHSVVCLETNKFYPCIADACNDLGIKSPTSITICLRENSRTAAGMHWVKSSKPLSSKECFDLLLKATVNNDRFTAVICVETKHIFQTRKTFEKQLKISTRKSCEGLKSGKLQFGSYTYMYVRDYIKSPLAEMLSENPE